MPESLNFTQQRIEKLPAPTKDRVDYYDAVVSSLICRVSASGNKSFCVLKRTAGGKLQRVTLGKFPSVSVAQARKLATEVLAMVADGINPTEEKRKQRLRGITLQELLNKYLSDKTDLREASKLDYTKKLNQGFSDWLNKPINDITRDMVLARRKQFEGGRDNKLRVLRLLMRYAVTTLKALDENPVDVLRDGSLWKAPTRKKRTIPSDKLKGWHEAVLGLGNEKAKVYLLLLLHTGLRDQDVRYLEWKDVDLQRDCLIARDTKNHTDFTTYIAPQIKPYLRSLQALTGHGRFVFEGSNADGVMDIPRKPIAQVCKASGVEFSSHDLKRTFLTIGEAAMIPFSLLKALANHKTDGDVTGGYINPEANTLKQAINKIADYIQQHTAPDSDNVQSFKTNTGT